MKRKKYAYGGTYQPVGTPVDPAEIRAQKAQQRKEEGNFWTGLGKFATDYALPMVASAVGGPGAALIARGLGSVNNTAVDPVSSLPTGPTMDYVDPMMFDDGTRMAKYGGKLKCATGGPLDPMHGPYRPLPTDTVPGANYIPAVMWNTPEDPRYAREDARTNARADALLLERNRRRLTAKSIGLDILSNTPTDPSVYRVSAANQGNAKSKSKDRFREYADGGDIQLNSQAFQVQGNPQVTDGNTYNMGNTKVALDHDEVVKDKFVFSDKIINPMTGNKFSADAKVIEKSIGKAEKKISKYNDLLSRTTVKHQQVMSDNLEQVHEAVAASKGLRNPDGSTRQSFYSGGNMGPGDPPYMQMEGGNIYYDPYNDRMLQRDYETVTYSPIEYQLWTKPTQEEISSHISKYPSSKKSIGPVNNINNYVNNQLTGTGAFSPEIPVVESSNPTQVPTASPRTSRLGKTKPTKNTTRPIILPSGVSTSSSVSDYVTMPDGSRIPKELDGPLAKPSAPLTMDQRAAAVENTPFLWDSDIDKYNKPWKTDAGYTEGFDEKGNIIPQNGVYASRQSYQTPFTVGDAMQGAEVDLKLWNSLKPAEVEPTRQINTPITQQTYDVSVPLYNSQRQYQNALNSYSGSLNTRRAIGSNMLAAKIGEDNSTLARYQDMNNTARLQFEDRIGQRRSQNIALQQYSADINSRNRAARANMIDNSLTGVGNFGQALNAKVQANDTMNILSKLYPNTYKGVEDALSYEDYLKFKKRGSNQ